MPKTTGISGLKACATVCVVGGVLSLGLLAIGLPMSELVSARTDVVTRPLTGVGTEELIDRLVNVDCQGPGFSPAYDLPDMFIPNADDAQLAAEFALEPTWHIPVEMRELIARGTVALPNLLAHVDDSRPTRYGLATQDFATVDAETDKSVTRFDWRFLGITLDREYDPRTADSAKPVPGVRLPGDMGLGLEVYTDWSEYTLRVGDVCYVAVGQIVNRNTHLFEADGENGLVLNSPIQTPALANAIRQDWSRLSPAAHRKSLITDAWSTDWKMEKRARDAVERLCFYYPEATEREVLRLLARKTFDSSAVYDFMNDRLLREEDRQKWQALLDTFRNRHGDAAATDVIEALADSAEDIAKMFEFEARPNSSVFSDAAMRTEYQQERERIVAVLNHLRAGTSGLPDAKNIADLWQQQNVIEASSRLRSRAVDRAVLKLYEQVQQMPEHETVLHKWLTEACAKRLAPTEYSPALREVAQPEPVEPPQQPADYDAMYQELFGRGKD